QLKASSVEILTPFVASDISGEDRIEKVLLEVVRGDQQIELDVDYVLCNYGFVSTLGPIKEWIMKIENNSIVVNSKIETDITAIYSAAYINTYPGKVKLIATGFGEGPTAVNNAKQYIDPKARIQPKHSTAMF